MARVKKITEVDRKEFETLEFDPDELVQLKEMSRGNLKELMIFCGIRVFNGVPFVVMEPDEMRMAYLVWRAERINKRKERIMPFVERGIKWIQYIQEAVGQTTN